jgi:putative N6-adenine-specific DNA methylase
MTKQKEQLESDAFGKRVRRHVIGRKRAYFVIVSPGFEEICRQELIGLKIDADDSDQEAGGVTFAGRFVDCQKANLYLRTATRILMRIDSFDATHLRKLKKRCAAIPWELFLPVGMLPRIQATSRRSRLYHTEAVSRAVREGIGRHSGNLRQAFSEQTLFVRLVEDKVTLSLDSSGAPLYKRGMKAGPAKAPIRESLAAAILLTAGYDGGRPLVDPMCGSGAFSLEAAMLAKHMAPGGQRNFAFMNWPAFGEKQWAYLKREAESEAFVLKRPMIFASDVDKRACNMLSGMNIDNGLSDAVAVKPKDFFDCESGQYGPDPGLVVINPPYGVRLGSADQAADLFQRICRHLKRAFGGWDIALIVPHKELLRRLPFAARQVPFTHGGLRLTLVLATLP